MQNFQTGFGSEGMSFGSQHIRLGMWKTCILTSTITTQFSQTNMPTSKINRVLPHISFQINYANRYKLLKSICKAAQKMQSFHIGLRQECTEVAH